MNDKAWLSRVKETHRYHVRKLKEDHKHRLVDTAKGLKRSIGSISEDLLVANWLKTHRDDIEKCEFFNEALDFIRKKKIELETLEID